MEERGARPAARRALGKPGARRDGCAAGSSVGFVARRSFCCAVNELVQGVRARFTEGCVFDFCKTTPFLYAYTFPLRKTQQQEPAKSVRALLPAATVNGQR